MAITKGKILKTINELDKLYNQTTNPNLQKYYSKLALLELCGWIEQSMDDIILKCAKRCLRNDQHIRFIENEVRRNYSFDYDMNFRKLLIQIIGLMNFEKLENNVKTVSLTTLKPNLDSIKPLRNSHAHTHLQNCTATFNAPSVTKRYFLNIFDALKDYEQTLKRLGL